MLFHSSCAASSFVTSSFCNVYWLNSVSYIFYKLKFGRYFKNNWMFEVGSTWENPLCLYTLDINLMKTTYFPFLSSLKTKVTLPAKLVENLNIQTMFCGCFTKFAKLPLLINQFKMTYTSLLHRESNNYAARQPQLYQITPPLPPDSPCYTGSLGALLEKHESRHSKFFLLGH